MIRVLGIDPGLAATGWGVVTNSRSRSLHLAHGTITTEAGLDLGIRLGMIFDAICEIVERFTPDAAAIEMLYFARNRTSALPVAHARGALMVALTRNGIPCHEYPPQEIKQSIVGNGRASKEQVQEMVRLLLGLAEPPRPNHSADALAAALCHVAHRPFKEMQRVQ